MLVLTRRKDQKIEFLNLGISVQIVDVQGKAIRLGIEAPHDVRIVRSELECYAKAPPRKKRLEKSEQQRRELDAANLALHLARNQLRQGLTARAEDAIDQALQCLQSVDESLANSTTDTESTKLSVHEDRAGYETSKSKSETATGLVFDGRPEQRNEVVAHLQNSGASSILSIDSTHTVDSVASIDGSDLVQWMLDNPQPKFALMICDPETQPLDIGPLGNLKLSEQIVQVASHHAMQWFSRA